MSYKSLCFCSALSQYKLMLLTTIWGESRLQHLACKTALCTCVQNKNCASSLTECLGNECCPNLLRVRDCI